MEGGTVMSAWDRKPSDELKKISIENMKKLAIILADMCYNSVKVYEEKKGIAISPIEMESVMDNELNLIVEQNIEDTEWREMIYKIAREKYNR
jgi:hypothetical protein